MGQLGAEHQVEARGGEVPGGGLLEVQSDPPNLCLRVEPTLDVVLRGTDEQKRQPLPLKNAAPRVEQLRSIEVALGLHVRRAWVLSLKGEGGYAMRRQEA